MKKTFIFFGIWCIVQNPLFAQIDNVKFDLKDTIYLPYIGNNILESISEIMNNTNIEYKKSTVIDFKETEDFDIPVKIWVFHDNDGQYHNPLTVTETNNILEDINQHYANNNASIKFYLKCEPTDIYNTNLNVISSDNEFYEICDLYSEPKTLNLYFAWGGASAPYVGIANFPWDESVDRRFKALVKSYNLTYDEIVRTAVHEIAHTFGVLHVYENARSSSGYNGDEDGKCYQESVSRSRENKLFEGCISTVGEKKCKINGDYLCDTEAAPNKVNDNIGRISLDGSCNYDGGGTDLWGDSWTPQTDNFMGRYDGSGCFRNTFTPLQIAVMQTNIMSWMGEGGGITDPYTGIIMFPALNGTPWYNNNALELSGSVYSGEVENITSSQTIDAAENADTYVIYNEGNVELKAAKRIRLHSGFSVKSGASFKAKVGKISDCSTVTTPVSTLKSAKINNIKEIQNDRISKCQELLVGAFPENNDIGNAKSYNVKKIFSNNEYIGIYPNPSDGIFSVESSDNIIQIKIFNTLGRKLSVYDRLLNTKLQIDLSSYNKGMYILWIITEKNDIIEKKILIY